MSKTQQMGVFYIGLIKNIRGALIRRHEESQAEADISKGPDG